MRQSSVDARHRSPVVVFQNKDRFKVLPICKISLSYVDILSLLCYNLLGYLRPFSISTVF